MGVEVNDNGRSITGEEEAVNNRGPGRGERGAGGGQYLLPGSCECLGQWVMRGHSM